MTDVTHVGRDGKESKMEHVYIRGSKVRMMVIPDMLKHAPMFKRIDPKFDPKGGKK
jgi:small nuclear ribonucleoprotein D3|tara:strand:- start:5854 stop:6021 length:168 start_codon:yes stop_codon:yes gene_type:complete